MESYRTVHLARVIRFVLTLTIGILCVALAISAAPATGADTFKAKCAMCHGPDGSGNTPTGKQLHIQDLRSADVQKLSDDELTAIITNGKPPMPAFGKALSAADIKQLVTYLRSIAQK